MDPNIVPTQQAFSINFLNDCGVILESSCTCVAVCRFRGVSKKKGKWEAKVMVNRKWAYRELFDSEEEAARAYDGAVWRLKPKEAKSYVNFKERPGQATSKLAKAAKMIERAQAKWVPLPPSPHSPLCLSVCECASASLLVRSQVITVHLTGHSLCSPRLSLTMVAKAAVFCAGVI